MWTVLLWHTLLPGSTKAIDLISHRPNHQNPQPKARLFLPGWLSLSLSPWWKTGGHSLTVATRASSAPSPPLNQPCSLPSRKVGRAGFPPLAIYEHWYYYVRSLVLSGLSPAWFHTVLNTGYTVRRICHHQNLQTAGEEGRQEKKSYLLLSLSYCLRQWLSELTENTWSKSWY